MFCIQLILSNSISKLPGDLGCCPFLGSGSVIVDSHCVFSFCVVLFHFMMKFLAFFLDLQSSCRARESWLIYFNCRIACVLKILW